MKKIIKIIAFFSIYIFSFYYINAETKPEILFISSYSPNFPTFIEQYNGIKEIYPDKAAKLQTEFLSTKQYPSGMIHDKIEETLLMKLQQKSKYDLVITADDNALHFVDKYYHLYFHKMPIVFFGVNNEEFGQEMGKKENITGIIEDISITENLQLIESIYPENTLQIISDDTPSGKSDLKRVLENISSNNYKFNTEILDLSEITWFDLEKKLTSVPNEPVLLLSAYKDKNAVNKTFDESITMIMTSHNGAAFHFWKHGLENGMLGGNLVDHHQYAKQAARIGQFLIKFEKKPRLNVRKGENTFIINYEAMKKLKFKKGNFPENTEFFNKPERNIEQYEDYFLLFIISLVGMVILIIILIVQIKLRISKEKELLKIMHEMKNSK